MRTRIAVPAIAASLALGGIFVLAGPALAYPASNAMPSNMTTGSNASDTMTSGLMGDNMSMLWFNDTGKMFGIISSLQNDELGEPAWMVTGHWMMTNDTAASNETETSSTNITDFYAGFQMIMLDGTAGHSHEIYNFTQDGDSMTDSTGNVTTVTGTSTVTMREGPVEDVETEITVSQGKVVAIWLDPEALDNHFGDTPIYGMAITPEILQHMMNTTTASTMMGDTAWMMCDKWRGNETGTASTEEMWK